MSLISKVAERVISTVNTSNQKILISSNPNLISPNPNLITPAPATFEAMPVLMLFLVFAAVVGLSVAFWRSQRVQRYNQRY